MSILKQINKGSKHLIKQINTSNVLKIIRDKKEISRAEISKLTGLTPATVSSTAKRLIQMNLIKEKGSGSSSGGRRPILLEVNREGAYVIGLDMGTTKLRFGIIDLYGNILKKDTKSFEETMTKDSMISFMKKSIYSLLSDEKIKIDKIVGIGIGVHGLVDSLNGVSLYAPAFGWRNLPIKEIFENEFNVEVYIENDARVMAIGEKWFGSGKDINDFIFINIGTGIGSGIYVDGSLYKGASNGAGEIGHISLEDRGICNCGNVGCFDALASSGGIVKRFNEIKKNHEKKEYIIDTFDSKKVYNLALKKDDEAQIVMKETGIYIGKAISFIANILNPKRVVIGGGVSESWDIIYPEIEAQIRKGTLYHNRENLIVVKSKLGEEAGLIGAGTLVIKNLFDFVK